MSTKAELYVMARLDGLGTRAAAREAGFAFGRPSAQARDMFKRTVALRTTPGLVAALATERAQVDRQRAKLDAAVEAHRGWEHAMELLAKLNGERAA